MLGTFHGAQGMSCVAGSLPSRSSRCTEQTQSPRRCAVWSCDGLRRGCRRVERGDAYALSQLTNPHHRPRSTVAGPASHLVHRDRELAIRALTAELAHDDYRVGWGRRENSRSWPVQLASRHCARLPSRERHVSRRRRSVRRGRRGRRKQSESTRTTSRAQAGAPWRDTGTRLPEVGADESRCSRRNTVNFRSRRRPVPACFLGIR